MFFVARCWLLLVRSLMCRLSLVRRMQDAAPQRVRVLIQLLKTNYASAANRRIIEATAERIGLPIEKVVINLDKYGNTTAATIPLALADARASGRLKKNDLVLLGSVGAGFTAGSVLLRWSL